MENIGPSPKYKWTLLSITTTGVLMVSIDVAVVVLAIPDMMRELHSNLVKMVWVLSPIFLSVRFSCWPWGEQPIFTDAFACTTGASLFLQSAHSFAASAGRTGN